MSDKPKKVIIPAGTQEVIYADGVKRIRVFLVDTPVEIRESRDYK